MKTRVCVCLVVIAALRAGSAWGAIWSDGFESGDMSAWTSSTNITVAGSYDYGQGQPRSGDYLAVAPSSYGSVGASKTFDTALSSVGDEVGGYMSISGYNQYRTTHWALIFAQNEAGNALAWAGLKLEEIETDVWMAKLYAHYGSMLGDPSLARSEEVGWDIQVTPYTEWVKVSFKLVANAGGDVDGIAIYVNDQKLPLLYTDGWQSFKEIKSIKFGSGWGSALSGYDDFYAVGLGEPVTCAEVLAEGYSIPEDYNENCYVDVPDLAHMADDWLRCMDPADANNCEQPWVPPVVYEGRLAYRASAAPAMTINGILTEWPANDYDPCDPLASQWIAIDKVYFGTPFDVADAFMCLMYDAATDVVYGAVTVTDSDPVYIDGVDFSWPTQDNIELYIQGDPDNDTPLDPQGSYANAQQFAIGLATDESTTYTLWGDHPEYPAVGSNGETAPVGLEAAVVRTINGGSHDVVYEFKVVPYDNYDGLTGDGSGTVQTNLSPGAQFALDVVLSVASSGYGMLCPNEMPGKSANVDMYATVTCE